MIIDVHTHCFPEKIAQKTVDFLAEKAKLTPYLNGTIQQLRASMHEAGVDVSVLMQIATKPSQTRTVNDWAAEVNSKDIIVFGSVHPQYEVWEEELERIKELGLIGVKFHPDYQEFFVDEERMIPFYRKISQLGLITMFHAGIDVGLYPPVYCQPKAAKKILQYFDAPVIMSHMGGCMMWDEVEEYLIGENVYLDTSMASGRISVEQMRRMIDKHGYNKILFATDSPWGGQKEDINFMKSFGFSETVEKAILGENAKKLLHIN